jgi:hypothetical protein
MKLRQHLLLLLSGISAATFAQINPALTPEWAKSLVIYEIATKSFTSPNGPESGTFTSLKERMPYLNDLGINGIWLTGHSLADPDHFYNIWTQYACLDPSKLDPTLGTERDFKALIDEAHRNGIRVFLDVITHGLMNESELVKQYPDWFEGMTEPWKMNDFRWEAQIKELDDWWVKTWVRYVTEFGVDGYRLDLSGERHDLWREIRRRCAEAGHEIVLFSEGAELIGGTYDFAQSYLKVVHGHGVESFTPARKDMAGYVLAKYGKETGYSVLVTYADASVEQYFTGDDPKEFSLLDNQADEVSYWETKPDGLTDRHFRIKVLTGKEIKSIQLLDAAGGIWNYPVNNRNYVLKMNRLSDGFVEIAGCSEDNNRPEGVLGSNEFSCHDNGWEGSPVNKSPFIAEGSRALFGYAALLAPAIPVFMSGEEFNCDFRPLPRLSPHLFGGARPGEGTWLYGNWIDWSQLQTMEKQEMMADVKKMISIRKTYSDVIAAKPISLDPNIAQVAISGDGSKYLPVPYVQWNYEQAIVVIANPESVDLELIVYLTPESTFGWKDGRTLTVTDIWNEAAPRQKKTTKNGTLEIPVQVTADKQSKGGLTILLIER